MKSNLDMSLIHDGQKWVARNGTIEASGSTLQELDENVKQAVIKSEKFKTGSEVVVFMGFDYDTIPRWMRQYHTHYFNRFVSIKL